jgi:hypothetical protein
LTKTRLSAIVLIFLAVGCPFAFLGELVASVDKKLSNDLFVLRESTIFDCFLGVITQNN